MSFCQVAALLRKSGQLREQSAVGVDQVQAGEHDDGQSRGEEYIYLALDAIVNLPGARGDLFFIFIVLDEQARDRRAERCLARLQGDSYLRARLVLLAALCQCESSVSGIPELGER